MGIEFERGVFENADDPSYEDDVSSSILVRVRPDEVDRAAEALRRCSDLWPRIDGVGRSHGRWDRFWKRQEDGLMTDDLSWHTAHYVSDVEITSEGPTVYVDCKGMMPLPMRDAFRDVLAKELRRVGIADAVVAVASGHDGF